MDPLDQPAWKQLHRFPFPWASALPVGFVWMALQTIVSKVISVADKSPAWLLSDATLAWSPSHLPQRAFLRRSIRRPRSPGSPQKPLSTLGRQRPLDGIGLWLLSALPCLPLPRPPPTFSIPPAGEPHRNHRPGPRPSICSARWSPSSSRSTCAFAPSRVCVRFSRRWSCPECYFRGRGRGAYKHFSSLPIIARPGLRSAVVGPPTFDDESICSAVVISSAQPDVLTAPRLWRLHSHR